MNGTLNLISSKKHAAYLAVNVKGHRNIHKMTDEKMCKLPLMYDFKKAVFYQNMCCLMNQNGVN